MKNQNNSDFAPQNDPLAALDAARENLVLWQTTTHRHLDETRAQLEGATEEAASTREQLVAAQTSANDLRDELSSARGELSEAKNQFASTRDALNVVQNDLADAQNDLAGVRDELARREKERADLQEEIAGAAAALETLRAEQKAARAELSAAQNDLASTRSELKTAREEAAQHAQAAAQYAENAQRAEEEKAGHRKRADDACAQLERSEQRRRELQKELLEVYADLRADDLPSLILRIAMKLTGAENGLFADAQGTRALASIGLDDLPNAIAESLFDFTREAAQMEEPLVKNNSEELPDHDNLVNLAALPVAVQGDLRGVILVANKRDAMFTEEDTETAAFHRAPRRRRDGKSSVARRTGAGLRFNNRGFGRRHRSQRPVYARPLRKRGASRGRDGAAHGIVRRKHRAGALCRAAARRRQNRRARRHFVEARSLVARRIRDHSKAFGDWPRFGEPCAVAGRHRADHFASSRTHRRQRLPGSFGRRKHSAGSAHHRRDRRFRCDDDAASVSRSGQSARSLAGITALHRLAIRRRNWWNWRRKSSKNTKPESANWPRLPTFPARPMENDLMLENETLPAESWLELRTTTPPDSAEWCAQILLDAGCGGAQIDDTEILFDESEDAILRLRERAIITAYWPLTREYSQEGLETLLRENGFNAPLETDAIAPQDWANNWRQNFPPLSIPPFLIVPTWEDENVAPNANAKDSAAPDANELNADARGGEAIELRIDPGLAFGTGQHPTTFFVLATAGANGSRVLAGKRKRAARSGCRLRQRHSQHRGGETWRARLGERSRPILHTRHPRKRGN